VIAAVKTTEVSPEIGAEIVMMGVVYICIS